MTKFQKRIRIPSGSPEAEILGICGDCIMEWDGQYLNITSNQGKGVSFILNGPELMALMSGPGIKFIQEKLGNKKRFERGIDVPGTSSQYTQNQGE